MIIDKRYVTTCYIDALNSVIDRGRIDAFST